MPLDKGYTLKPDFEPFSVEVSFKTKREALDFALVIKQSAVISPMTPWSGPGTRGWQERRQAAQTRFGNAKLFGLARDIARRANGE